MAPRGPVASGALLIYLLTAGVAALGGQAHEAKAQVPPAPAKSSTKPPDKPAPPDMSAIVERIQKRIDEEVVKPAAARAAVASRKPAAPAARPKTAAPSDGRIRLVWRISLVWPQELIAER